MLLVLSGQGRDRVVAAESIRGKACSEPMVDVEIVDTVRAKPGDLEVDV